MSFKTTKDNLKTILDGLTGTGASDLFREVFDYMEPDPKQFPCAMVGVLNGSSEEMQDSEYNATTMAFIIRCYLTQNNDSATHDLVLTTLDGLLEELRKQSNLTLSASSQMMDVAPEIEVFYTDRTDEPLVGFDVRVNVLKLNQTN